MAVRLAINGFGRIGRLILRALLESKRSDVEIVAINDLGSAEENAHLLKYDSIHGPLKNTIEVKNGNIVVDGKEIIVYAEPTPEKLPWGKLGINIALECSGRFTTRTEAVKHLMAGAKKVLVSAPTKDADLTVVYGVNHRSVRLEHTVISNASCTTNCLAPIAQVLNQTFGIESGFMTTVHAYTGDQRLVDSLHPDPRRARAATLSMIPTSTGAAQAVGLVLPELDGKLDGTAVRVPTPNVSMIDFTFTTKKNCSVTAINNAIQEATLNPSLKGILTVNHEPLVSIDFNHNPASAVFDTTQTQVTHKNFARILAWYDNEWGFSNRMLDTASHLGKTI